MAGIRMNLQDFTKLLDDFAEATKNKEYQRISYEIWRCLKQFHGEVNLVKSANGWTLSSSNSDHRVFCAWDDCSLGTYLENKFNNITIENIKENDKTMNLFNNIDFGPVDGDKVRMSAYGMAIKNATGTWVAYDAKNKNIMDVEIFNFDGSKFMYKMPVAVGAVKPGDVVIHMKKPAYVTEVKGNTFVVIDAYDGSVKEILPTKNCFNFNYLTKVVSFIDFNSGVNADNPFGNLLPLMLLSDGANTEDMLPLLLLSQNGGANLTQNPMLLYMLMGRGGNSDMLLPLMLAGGANPFAAMTPATSQANV